MKTKRVKENSRAEKSSEKRVSHVISLRLSTSELTEVRDRAEAEGLSVSEYIREVLTGGIEGAQMRLPFTDQDGDQGDDQDARAEMEAFLNTFAISARSLAKGWLRCKALPKIERSRKAAKKADACQNDAHYMRLPGEEECPGCGQELDRAE